MQEGGLTFDLCRSCRTSRTCKTFKACYQAAKRELAKERPKPQPYLPPLTPEQQAQREERYIALCASRGGFPVCRGALSQTPPYVAVATGGLRMGGSW